MNFTAVKYQKRRTFLLRTFISAILCVLGQLLMVEFAVAQAAATAGTCPLTWGGLTRDYRPEKYVYENTYRSHGALLKLVEDAHFTPNVESLRSSKNGTGKPGPDLAYTLRVYPNHHRALIAMAALSEKERTPQPNGSDYSVECWFFRAISFAPDDNIARMIYVQYLIKEKREVDAEKQLTLVADQAGDNAFTINNIGLLYFDMKNYEKALLYSHKAYELGLGIHTLRDQLESVGKWSDPVDVPAVEPAKNPQ